MHYVLIKVSNSLDYGKLPSLTRQFAVKISAQNSIGKLVNEADNP